MSPILRWSRALAALPVVVLVSAAGLAAQGVSTGLLYGTVRDAKGELLAGATIRAVAVDAGVDQSTESTAAGGFRLAFLPPARYDIVIEQLGFRPQRILGVPLRPGTQVRLDIDLSAATPPIDVVDTVRVVSGALAGSRAGIDQWLGLLSAQGLPGEDRGISLLASLSSESDARLETEGLPGRLTGLVVDGLPTDLTDHPDVPATLRAAPFMLPALDGAELVTNGADVEWGDRAGGFLGLFTRQGSKDPQLRAFGAFGPGALTSSKFFSPGDLSPTDMYGSLVLGGAMSQDSARYALGFDLSRADRAAPPAWEAGDSLVSGIAQIASGTYGQDLNGLGAGYLARTTTYRGYGRFDWNVTPTSRLMLRTNFGGLTDEAPDLTGATLASPIPRVSGTDLAAAGSLFSQLGAGLSQELDLAFDYSKREYASQGGGGLGVTAPATVFSVGGIGVNGGAALEGDFSLSTVHLRDVLFYGSGQHQIKFGGGVTLSSYDQRYVFGHGGIFTFGGVQQFAQGRGAFVQASGAVPEAKFTIPELGLFAQDTWQAAPGVELQFGARLDVERLPLGRTDGARTAWRTATGIDLGSPSRSILKPSPRASATWDVADAHQWIVRAAAGLYHDRTDPAIFADAVAEDGSVTVKRGVGAFGWPNAPDVPAIGAQLALLAPDVKPPRTARGSIGITRQLGEAALQLSATIRRTDRLPQRRDLNLTPAAIATDSHGRAIFGPLIQQGALVVAQPGNNRRFGDFDVVSAYSADARSDYVGLTVGLERFGGRNAHFFGRYTYSRTTDDWTWARLDGTGPRPIATDTVAGQ
ncbi:MAG TPA: carboxypeptidase regulatory-like domain-containing protein, partial [Longimicrobiales bacterium]|nr:carboxypeptidase regulatory-like domain-containing protein [Longimicrobiales bacterium]